MILIMTVVRDYCFNFARKVLTYALTDVEISKNQLSYELLHVH